MMNMLTLYGDHNIPPGGARFLWLSHDYYDCQFCILSLIYKVLQSSVNKWLHNIKKVIYAKHISDNTV